MILIGIGNKARHGKDTSSNAIALQSAALGIPFLRISWADALYDEVNQFLAEGRKSFRHADDIFNLGVIDPSNSWVKFPSWVTPTPNAEISSRAPYGKHSKLLQWWGTEYRRGQDPSYWVKKGVEAVKKFEQGCPSGVVIIPDTRFLNEADAIKRLGGYTLHVSRLEENGHRYSDPHRDPIHSSETELDSYNWDFEIASKNVELTRRLAVATFDYIRERCHGG